MKHRRRSIVMPKVKGKLDMKHRRRSIVMPKVKGKALGYKKAAPKKAAPAPRNKMIHKRGMKMNIKSPYSR